MSVISREEACALAAVSGAELARLMDRAAGIRDGSWGRNVTYSRKVFVPLTNLCRDKCGYCTFAKQPGTPGAGYLTPEQVLQIVRRGEALGCKEALFSLGEKPELLHPEAADMLAALGYESTIDYVIAMCKRVLEETSLVPHVNAGTLDPGEVRRVKAVAGSAGIMLETISRRLTARGQAHFACPDKVPVQRLRTLERAGEASLPMTTGILIGIGETWEERIDSLLAIAELHVRYGHIQEVIVQNFRAKPGTPMALCAEPDMDDMLRTLAVARLLLPPGISLQAPPNLNEAFERYLLAGINDFGGISPVTADHINPERAWPAVGEIARRSATLGFELVERLTAYPSFLQPQHVSRFFGAKPLVALAALARVDGLARHQAHERLQSHQEVQV
ncbi:7,8-didemethyl-8-hydroxy-5-deazariboflavin synthase CofG [Caballeronia sp. LZ035]|uniref:7,8-didemethyl-8-hydroxy-5-deazariboflavin synthase CofG n=1 Tax=Caballeronia sp. LZ035 TaxID=3038568 RepID=UPI00285B1692|nr:7,8-didemethyl-8-hydroxy-5-deazariboflavin synthase CofG [Caballeronia sp. LZ035]MDR5761394.1 7,8-didemethyl-8-hydroxy-5-deazariboflavin synthase CofG [Caballeronia sp. LZ035]